MYSKPSFLGKNSFFTCFVSEKRGVFRCLKTKPCFYYFGEKHKKTLLFSEKHIKNIDFYVYQERNWRKLSPWSVWVASCSVRLACGYFGLRVYQSVCLNRKTLFFFFFVCFSVFLLFYESDSDIAKTEIFQWYFCVFLNCFCNVGSLTRFRRKTFLKKHGFSPTFLYIIYIIYKKFRKKHKKKNAVFWVPFKLRMMVVRCWKTLKKL